MSEERAVKAARSGAVCGGSTIAIGEGMRSFLGLSSLLVGLLVPSLAHAEEERPADTSRRQDVRIVAGLGASHDAQSSAATFALEAL